MLWLLALFLLLSLTCCQDTVFYFYSTELDNCAWEGNRITASNNTENGGLCAYDEYIKRVYACPALDPVCWTFAQNCGSGTVAGPNQIFCNNGGNTWCCASKEICTLDQDAINICTGNFTNPNKNVQPAAAYSAELNALGVTSVGTAALTGTPSIISTTIIDQTAPSAAPTTFSSTYTSSSLATLTYTSSSSTTSTHISSTSAISTSPPSHGVSIGTAVGVGIGGGCAVVILGTAIVLFILRRRKYGQASLPYPNPQEPYRSQQLPQQYDVNSPLPTDPNIQQEVPAGIRPRHEIRGLYYPRYEIGGAER